MRKLRAAGYIRLSKEDYNLGELDVSESVINQRSFIATYIEEQGWELTKFYIDEDISGSDRDRPEFNSMITDAYAKEFDIIVCKKQSRFARDLELIEKYVLGEFLEIGIRFIAILDHIDTNSISSSTRKNSQISGLVDQWYLEDLSDNIRAALGAKIRRGESIASFPPYGYQKDPKNKNKYIINPETAPVVKRMFQMYLEGYGFEAIAKTFNAEGIPNWYTYQKGFTNVQRGNETDLTYRWRGSTIAGMLKNERYIGTMVQGRYKKASYKSKKLLRRPESEWIKIENCHEPIIDLDTWNAVQEQRKIKRRATRTGRQHPLSGKVYCGKCGGRLILGSKASNGQQSYYSCSTRRVAIELCEGSSISDFRLEAIVLERLRELIHDYLDEEYQIECLPDPGTQLEEIERKLKMVRGEIEATDQNLKIMYQDRLTGVLTLDDFMNIKADIDKKRQTLQEKENIYLEQKKTCKDTEERLESKKRVLQEYSNITMLTVEATDRLIKKIIVTNDGKDKVVEILWNF